MHCNILKILISFCRTSIEALESKLNSWNEFDVLKESCLTWLRETDYKIHAIDLKNSLQEKKTQLEELKVIIFIVYIYLIIFIHFKLIILGVTRNDSS